MGELLTKYYQMVQAEGGLPAKMRLAAMTGVPASEAEKTVETPETLARFRRAVHDITGRRQAA